MAEISCNICTIKNIVAIIAKMSSVSQQSHSRHRSTFMMTLSNGNIFRVAAPLCGEFTGHQWIIHTKASDAGLHIFFGCAWINGWVNNREAGDLRRYRAHYDVIVMYLWRLLGWPLTDHRMFALITPQEGSKGWVKETQKAESHQLKQYLTNKLQSNFKPKIFWKF